mgnify:CR=1 FL=1
MMVGVKKKKNFKLSRTIISLSYLTLNSFPRSITRVLSFVRISYNYTPPFLTNAPGKNVGETWKQPNKRRVFYYFLSVFPFFLQNLFAVVRKNKMILAKSSRTGACVRLFFLTNPSLSDRCKVQKKKWPSVIIMIIKSNNTVLLLLLLLLLVNFFFVNENEILLHPQ